MDKAPIPPGQIEQIQDDAPLPKKVVEHLRSMIMKGELHPGSKLPNEPDLARSLNVSRSTLRVALERLSFEGIVVRKRGVGTFISDVPLVINNLNLNHGVTEIIQSIGSEPGTIELIVETGMAGVQAVKRLELEPESPVFNIERVRTADGRRVVYSYEVIPFEALKTSSHVFSALEIEEYLNNNQSVYKFLEEEIGLEIHHAIAWLSPVTADNTMAAKLNVPDGSGLLYLEQVDYDTDGNPIVLADEYHVADAFKFTVFRSR